MKKSLIKSNLIFKLINNSLIKLPTPINISIWWNFGSLLGMMMLIQILSGLFLSMHYNNNSMLAFYSMIHIMQNVNFGWLIRLLHMNGSSMFFICMYTHMGRSIYYGSYNLIKPWITGVMNFMLSMMTAFLGYVLPWGQMSFWGAMVITNLISTIPYIGNNLVEWIWGGFSISGPTLTRFFSMHFILPFFIFILVIMHLMFIHETGSSNPLGINSNLNKIPFNIYFTYKDMLGFMIILMILMLITFFNPLIINDPENFIMANPMITPTHIQPEWYFLFAYSILRSIPNKLGGMIALLMSISILLIMPILTNNKLQSNKFYPINQILFWIFINIIIMLTWLGSKPIEPPFIMISQIMTIMYFLFYFLNPLIMYMWDKLFN